MTASIFSDAMGEIGEKYIMEAISYRPKKKQTVIPFRGLSKRAVAIVAIIVALLTTACSVKAFREAISEFFIGMCDSCYDFFIEHSSPDTIEQRYCFVTYPEGFEETSDEVAETFVVQRLQNADGDKIVLSQVVGEGSLAVDAEKGKIEKFDVNGIEVLLYVRDGNNIAIWVNNSYYFTLAYYGDIDVQSMKELIEMIEIKED